MKITVKNVLSFLLTLLLVLSLFPALLSCGLQEYAPSDNYADESDPADPGFIITDQSPSDVGDDASQPGGASVDDTPEKNDPSPSDSTDISVDEDGEYDDAEHVALYIATYGTLPKNYISKKDAEALGWEGGSLDAVVKGKCIGGSYFGNYEGLLPTAEGRKYYECDIDTIGQKSRGSKRIVYSNDGLVYYTEDHYETFTLLYGEE